MSSIKNAILDFLTNRIAKRAIERSTKVRKRAEFLLNGTDDWLTVVNVCPETNADETECPPEFDDVD